MPVNSRRSAFGLIVALPLLGACAATDIRPSDGDGPPGNGWYREPQGSLWEQPAPRYLPPPSYSAPCCSAPPAPRYNVPLAPEPETTTPANPSPPETETAPPETTPVEPGPSPPSSSWFSWFSGSSPDAPSSGDDDCTGWWRICHFLP